MHLHHVHYSYLLSVTYATQHMHYLSQSQMHIMCAITHKIKLHYSNISAILLYLGSWKLSN